MEPCGRRAWVLAAALALAGACGEDETTTVAGNVGRDCPAGDACTCSVTGNCYLGCNGGGCALTCAGTSNCFLTCAGGDCAFECANDGNCQASCKGGGCAMTCTGTNNGVLSGCPQGCTAVRTAGTGTCAVVP